MKAITVDLRDGVRRALSSFFGGDGPLYWALNSAIWPELSKPMTEAMDQLLSASDYEDLAELDAPWRFVTEGWCDEAEN